MTTDTQIIDYSPAIVNIEGLVQGDSLPFKVIIKSDGTPVNLTGTTTEMDIKRLDDTLVLTLTVGDGITYTNPTAGEMTILLEPAETANLDPEYTYRYDVQWTSGASVRTVAWGTITTLKQITT